jgi:hypothetical protein
MTARTMTICENEELVDTHPFLDDNINECDHALVRILLDKRTYATGHGEVGAAWAVVVQKCNNLHDENGQKLFIPELHEVTMLLSCMKNFIMFTKKHQKKVPMRSGCDEEKPMYNNNC